MNVNFFLNNIDEIKESVFTDNLSHAFILTENILASFDFQNLQRDFQKTKSTFEYLLDYFAKDYPDPQRPLIYNNIKKDLITIVDILKEKLKKSAADVPDYRNIYLQYPAKHDIPLLLQKFKNDYQQNETLFRTIWLTDKFDTNIKIAFDDFFASDISDIHKSVVVSALSLSLWRIFESKKFLTLLDIYKKNPDYASGIRALTGVIITILLYDKTINLFDNLKNELKTVFSDNDTLQKIELILLQLVKSTKTEDVIREFEQDILPEMMKMKTDLRKFDIDDLSTENMMDDENPGWTNFFDENPELFERLEKFTMQQFDGTDIFSATLGSMKNFPFFLNPANWFLPFYSENQEIANALKLAIGDELTDEFMKAFENAGYFCNSDKYSFCLHIPQIAGPMRESAIRMLIAEMEGAAEMMKDEDFNTSDKIRSTIIQYIQDLYRFFNFNKNIKGFENIFKTKLNIEDNKILELTENYVHTIRSIAELYFKDKYYLEAAMFFEKIIEKNINEADVYEKTGFAFQKSKMFDKAKEYYEKAEFFNDDKKWLMKKLGFVNYKLENYEKSLEYYRKAEQKDPDDIAVQTFIAKSYSASGKYEDALKYFFKAHFYKENDVKIMRMIAYCSFKLKKFDQALNYAQNCINIAPDKFDFFISAIINFIKNDKKEAFDYLKTAASEFDNFSDFKNELELFKDELIENGYNEFDITLIFDFMELKYYDI